MPNLVCSNRYIAKLILFAGILVVGFNSAGHTADVCGTARTGDQIWLVSTRQLGCGSLVAPQAYDVQHLDAEQRWQTAEPDSLLQADPGVPIVVYIHGNRANRCKAIAEGWHAYQAITSDFCGASAPNIQFVIWSWPSDRVRGELRDVRLKARRTDLEAYLLAQWLACFDSQCRVGLIGHSYGARIVSGSLHLLGGGPLAGHSLSEVPAKPFRARVVLLAAALHNYWLRPGCRNDTALTCVDHLLNLYNRCDPVLRHYRILDKYTRAEALGYTGMRLSDLSTGRESVRQQDVCCSVGRSHGAEYYFDSPGVLAQIRTYALWQPLDTPLATPAEVAANLP